MGYRMRYFVTDHKERPLTLRDLETGLRHADSGYSMEYQGQNEEAEYALLSYNGHLCGPVELRWAGHLFDAEIDGYREQIEIDREECPERDWSHYQEVVDVVDATDALFVMQILLGSGEDIKTIFKRIDPVFVWLSQNRRGLLFADLEGFYRDGKLIMQL